MGNQILDFLAKDAILIPDKNYVDPYYGDVSSEDESSISRECLSEGFCFSVYGGYALDFSDPPEIIVWTNPEDDPPPDNVELKAGEGTTTWGKGLILWQEGDWVEIVTSGSFNTLGVQVYGDKTIGWARVLFDGLEIWRGDTAEVWTDGNAHAVYVEVDNIVPGNHTLRIESLGIDGGGGGKSIPVGFFGLR